ncbi:uncharacterized protein LOC125942433 [Dermacentor silvarum]|uniref:uncharacterized protein LOC125942433 n=1 Tax=Dermacentor silvarum TaxID=543639 RepID=UPI0021013616|nr:uncharacterized protein LOC125942433 [Dermacentor silvarum]
MVLLGYHRHTALTEKRTAAVQHAAGAGIHPVTCVTQQPTAAGYHASGTAEESRDTAVVSDSNCNDTQGASVSEDEDIAPVEENDASGTSFDEALADFNCNNTQGASVSEDEDIAPVEENDASGTSFDEAVADFNCNDTQGASVSEDEDIAPVEENDASGTSFDEAVAARTESTRCHFCATMKAKVQLLEDEIQKLKQGGSPYAANKHQGKLVTSMSNAEVHFYTGMYKWRSYTPYTACTFLFI